MTNPRFAPHGQFDIVWCDDVLYSRLTGTFNVQAMRQYIAEIKARGDSRTTRWGRLADMRGWEGMTPEAAALFKEFAEWIKTTRCKVSVQLLPQAFQRNMVALAVQRLNVTHLYQVTTLNEAIAVYSDYRLDSSSLPDLLQFIDLERC